MHRVILQKQRCVASGIFPSSAVRPERLHRKMRRCKTTTRLCKRQAIASSRESVSLYYATDWPSATLHFSLSGQPWEDLALSQVLRSLTGFGDLTFVQTVGRRWKMVSVLIGNTSSSMDPLLEFVVTDRNGNWDKAEDGGNFLIEKTGHYQLKDRELKKLKMQRVMVVSDLDGTMIGDNIATKAFSDFWTLQSYLTDSILVYNTGRSVDSFLELLEERKDCLKIPDVLISAVGTKVYMPEDGKWFEDPVWISQLDQNWDASLMKAAASSALKLVGSDSMHFRPDEEQNEHKVTCGVQQNCLNRVLDHIHSKVDDAQLKANLISSGIGEWRFLDIVSEKAGKLEALNYVRAKYGFSVESTVACGDSGNDILMLSGENLAIVVSNAQPDLKDWSQKEENKNQSKNRLFLATKHEAYGILEGLEHFGFY